MLELTRVIVGSQLHGTSTPTSDTDYKAVHVPDWQSILLGNSGRVIESNTKLDKGSKNTAEDIDLSSYSVSKFIKLLCDGDTSAVEMLLAPAEFRLTTSEQFEYIYANRFRLLNRKSKAFVGYVKSQSVKYSAKGNRLKTARAVVKFLQDLHNGPQKLIAAAGKIGYYEDRINQFIKDNEHCSIKVLTMPNGSEIKHLEVCGKLLPFTNTIVSGINMYRPMELEYGERAKQAASNNSVDYKAVSHAYRIAEECIELLTTGNIVFPRPNGGFLRDIKTGKVLYSEIVDDLERLLEKAEVAAESSVLPESSDTKFANDTIIRFHLEQVEKGTK